MSDYKFKPFSEIDTVEAPSEAATLVGIENGKPIQMPMKSMKTGEPIIINYNTYSASDSAFGDKVREGLLNGVPVWVYYPIDSYYGQIIGFGAITLSNGRYIMPLIPSLAPLASGSSIYGTGVNINEFRIPIMVSTDEV